MRASNRLAVKHLILHGYDEVWLKAHSARNDTVYCQDKKYLATDLWNLFDGICFGGQTAHYIQIKTNSWADAKPIQKFIQTHHVVVIVINVTSKRVSKGKWKVFTRLYQ